MHAPHPAAAPPTESTPLPPTAPPDRWSRVLLATLTPCIDGGRWPIQRSVGEEVEVEAGVIVDGHEKLAVELQWRHEDDGTVQTAPMRLRYNDEYVARFRVERLGRYEYRVRAWLDAFGTWQDQFRRRVEGGAPKEELATELLDGATLLHRAANQASAADRKRLERYAKRFEKGEAEAALENVIVELARRSDPADGVVESAWLGVRVDTELARFGAWYEFFPRSAADRPGTHGTLDDATARLPRRETPLRCNSASSSTPPGVAIHDTRRRDPFGRDSRPRVVRRARVACKLRTGCVLALPNCRRTRDLDVLLDPGGETEHQEAAHDQADRRERHRHAQQVLAGIGFTTEHAFHRYLKRSTLEGILGSADAVVLDLGRRLLAERRVPKLIEL